MSLELQKKGVLCWLKHTYNWFNKSTEYCWRGKFRCISKNCPINYTCIINKNINLGVTIEVTWDNLEAAHIKLRKAKRCVGESRNTIARNLISYGNSNIRQDHILRNLIHNGNNFVIHLNGL